VLLKQNDGLIEMYYLKTTKNKMGKTNCCVFGYNNEPELPKACFHLFPHCGVKPKYVFVECVLGTEDRIKRRKA
jgi:hypothetical protein